MSASHAGTLSKLSPRLQAYLDAVFEICSDNENKIVSLVLFGSVTTGSFSAPVSDVDLIVIMDDDAGPDQRRTLERLIENLEIQHGLRQPAGHRGALDSLMDRVTAHDRSFFVCTRADLISGTVSRILNLAPAQAFFVDRIVISGILSTAVTIWGEDILPGVCILPIRRLDILISLFAQFCNASASAALFPVLPDATRFSMAALKHAIHSCYFCYFRGRPDSLENKARFFRPRISSSRALDQLLELRGSYKPSFPFVVRCLPALIRLHLRTARDWKRTARDWKQDTKSRTGLDDPAVGYDQD